MLQLLNKTITVNRTTIGQGDNWGTTTESTTAVYSNVPAAIQPASGSVQEFYSKRNIVISNTIFVPRILILRVGDQITDGTYTYQVMGWRDMGGRGLMQAIDALLYSA